MTLEEYKGKESVGPTPSLELHGDGGFEFSYKLYRLNLDDDGYVEETAVQLPEKFRDADERRGTYISYDASDIDDGLYRTLSSGYNWPSSGHIIEQYFIREVGKWFDFGPLQPGRHEVREYLRAQRDELGGIEEKGEAA